MSKVKLNVYHTHINYPMSNPNWNEDCFFAAKDDTLARRYVNTLEEQIGDGTRFYDPIDIGTIKLDKKVISSRGFAEDGTGVIKLGKLEQVHVG